MFKLSLSMAVSTLLLSATFTTQNAYSQTNDGLSARNANNSDCSIQLSNDDSINHNLDFEKSSASRKICIDKKTYTDKTTQKESTDGIFVDGLGREVLFRGWNTSGAVKLTSMDFKPFKSREDAKTVYDNIGQKTGSNQIRFTVAWEGIHTAPDVIDYAYLDDIIAQMREAIKHRMYIIVDYHSDLYSRHTFTKDSKDTGNGAPKWIVKGAEHGTDNCGFPCDFSWGAHKLADDAVRSAMRAFWLDSPITTSKGERKVQSEFLWQLGKVADYLNKQLTPAERDYLLGIEPLNEPFDAGIDKLGLKDFSEFDNQIIWPFYQRVRTTMNSHGMSDKAVYAEPMVFWYTTTGAIAPATGRHYLKNPPGKGFVFAPHMYDQARMGVGVNLLEQSGEAKNAAYLYKLDEARDEARFLGNIPIFLGEYGMWLEGKDKADTSRVITGSIQALETSTSENQQQTTKQQKEQRNKSRHVDFYTPWIHGAQWHWNHYYGHSRELQNGNPDKVITENDAWNKENFSVVKEYSSQYNHQKNSVERAYPRRTQGRLMHFAYNAKTVDTTDKKPLDWLALRVDLPNRFVNREYFRDRKFALTVWQGRHSDYPTEIFLPRDFKPAKTTVITEKVIQRGFDVTATPRQTANEVLLTADPTQIADSGHRLLVWDDIDTGENTDTGIHFALQVEQTDDMTMAALEDLQAAIKLRLQAEKSPLYLTGDMTFYRVFVGKDYGVSVPIESPDAVSLTLSVDGKVYVVHTQKGSKTYPLGNFTNGSKDVRLVKQPEGLSCQFEGSQTPTIRVSNADTLLPTLRCTGQVNKYALSGTVSADGPVSLTLSVDNQTVVVSSKTYKLEKTLPNGDYIVRISEQQSGVSCQFNDGQNTTSITIAGKAATIPEIHCEKLKYAVNGVIVINANLPVEMTLTVNGKDYKINNHAANHAYYLDSFVDGSSSIVTVTKNPEGYLCTFADHQQVSTTITIDGKPATLPELRCSKEVKKYEITGKITASESVSVTLSVGNKSYPISNKSSGYTLGKVFANGTTHTIKVSRLPNGFTCQFEGGKLQVAVTIDGKAGTLPTLTCQKNSTDTYELSGNITASEPVSVTLSVGNKSYPISNKSNRYTLGKVFTNGTHTIKVSRLPKGFTCQFEGGKSQVAVTINGNAGTLPTLTCEKNSTDTYELSGNITASEPVSVTLSVENKSYPISNKSNRYTLGKVFTNGTHTIKITHSPNDFTCQFEGGKSLVEVTINGTAAILPGISCDKITQPAGGLPFKDSFE